MAKNVARKKFDGSVLAAKRPLLAALLVGVLMAVGVSVRRRLLEVDGVAVAAKAESPSTGDKHYLYIKIKCKGRLGNFMFIHASTLGIARSLNLTPVIDAKGSPLPAVFRIGTRRLEDVGRRNWSRFAERYAHVYDDRVQRLHADVDQKLTGYFQSWKYFADPDAVRAIRAEFRFREPILRRAESFLDEAVARHLGTAGGGRRYQTATATVGSRKIVGVHVRRGDMVGSRGGYTTAPASYIARAMAYFERRYDGAELLFVVCSDTIGWAKENIGNRSTPIVFSEAGDPALDMAILSLWSDVTMTVGSFGWWSAWLADGLTVYYNGYPKAHSDDYYPSRWIPMSA